MTCITDELTEVKTIDEITVVMTKGEMIMIMDALKSLGSQMTSDHRRLYADLRNGYKSLFPDEH